MSASIKIDKGVPIPSRRNGRGGGKGCGPVYPWAEMSPGDSFVMPTKDGDALIGAQSRAAGIVTSRRVLQAANFVTRAVTEDGERVVRIWRVS